MHDTANKFSLTYNLALIQVEKLYDEAGEMYKIEFSNEVPPVMIICRDRACNCEWDTVPPGNTELAHAIGNLIDKHLNENK